MMKEFEFFDGKLSDLTPDMREVYLLMGYGSHTPDGAILQVIDEVLSDLQECISLRYGYVLVHGGRCGKEQLQLGNETFLQGLLLLMP